MLYLLGQCRMEVVRYTNDLEHAHCSCWWTTFWWLRWCIGVLDAWSKQYWGIDRSICCICLQRHRNCFCTKKMLVPIMMCQVHMYFKNITQQHQRSASNMLYFCMSNYGNSVKNLFYTSSCLFVKNNNSMKEFVSQKIFHCKPNLAKSRNLYGTSCVDNPPCPCRSINGNWKGLKVLLLLHIQIVIFWP